MIWPWLRGCFDQDQQIFQPLCPRSPGQASRTSPGEDYNYVLDFGDFVSRWGLYVFTAQRREVFVPYTAKRRDVLGLQISQGRGFCAPRQSQGLRSKKSPPEGNLISLRLRLRLCWWWRLRLWLWLCWWWRYRHAMPDHIRLDSSSKLLHQGCLSKYQTWVKVKLKSSAASVYIKVELIWKVTCR